LVRDIGEIPAAVVCNKDMVSAGNPRGPHMTGIPSTDIGPGQPGRGSLLEVEVHVVNDNEILIAVAD